MANNRMWLTHKPTGERVLLAKYYPSTGWYVRDDDLVDRLTKLFDGNEHRTVWGDTGYELEYESDADKNLIAEEVGDARPHANGQV
jgi:hypothetical protein